MHRATAKDSGVYLKLENKISQPGLFSVKPRKMEAVSDFISSGVNADISEPCQVKIHRMDSLEDYYALNFLSKKYAARHWDYIVGVSNNQAIAMMPKYVYDDSLVSRLYIPNELNVDNIYLLDEEANNKFTLVCQLSPN